MNEHYCTCPSGTCPLHDNPYRLPQLACPDCLALAKIVLEFVDGEACNVQREVLKAFIKERMP